MTSKKFAADQLMKNFMSAPSEPEATRQQLEPPTLPPVEEATKSKATNSAALASMTRTAEVKEKRVATTFFLSESLDKRLCTFVFREKDHRGRKVTKTQIITEAIQRYLDEMENPEA